MTFNEAVKRKVRKMRLPFFPTGAYCDPRVTEDERYVLIINPRCPVKDLHGNIAYAKVMITAEMNWEEVAG